MAKTHDTKSHDYASNDNPSGNYHFAGRLALLFAHSEQDAGFIGRLGEKFYRLANLEASQKIAKAESIEDTERDIATITTLWMSDRRDRRVKKQVNIDKVSSQLKQGTWTGFQPAEAYQETAGEDTATDKPSETFSEEYATGKIIELMPYISLNMKKDLVTYLQRSIRDDEVTMGMGNQGVPIVGGVGRVVDRRPKSDPSPR